LELSQIYTPIQADLNKVKDTLMSISQMDFAWLAQQLSHVVKGTGKGIRPALTLLSGKSFEYDLNYLLPMAVSVELMHTATLVHDDAIDKSDTRRGQQTINSIWGDEIAILMGDYLFAKAGEFVSDTQTPRVIKLFSQAKLYNGVPHSIRTRSEKTISTASTARPPLYSRFPRNQAPS
jgi:octaprenyl-diphosphate synthase